MSHTLHICCSQLFCRSAGSVTSHGTQRTDVTFPEVPWSEWHIDARDIQVARRDDGREWKLGGGAFGEVRSNICCNLWHVGRDCRYKIGCWHCSKYHSTNGTIWAASAQAAGPCTARCQLYCRMELTGAGGVTWCQVTELCMGERQQAQSVSASACGWWQETHATHAVWQRSCCGCSVLCTLK